MAGDYVFTIDSSGAWDTQSIYDRATTALLDWDDWRDTARSILYAPGMERIFMLNSGVSPTDINYIDVDFVTGTISEETDSPYHGSYSLPNPIRIVPDESMVVVGSGNFFNTSDLTYATSFGLAFEDLAFIGADYFLLQAVGPNSEIIRLDAGFNILSATWFTGEPRRLFAWDGDLYLVTRTGPNSHFLERIDPSTL